MQLLRRLSLRALLLALAALPLDAADPRTLGPLLQARQELGAHHWSAILELSTGTRFRRTSVALVFEFAEALWLYRPEEGTQSLSRHWHDVAAERRALLPLLRGIDPTVVGYRECGVGEVGTAAPPAGVLPNGCFIRSVAEARRLRRENRSADCCLLSYYAATPAGQVGHTVLLYRDEAGLHVFDPAEGATAEVHAVSLCDEALALARRVVPWDLAPRLTKAAKIVLRVPGPSGARPGRCAPALSGKRGG